MINLRKIAQGQSCQIRLFGICTRDNTTTVLAHFRLIGLSGMGLKSPDWLGSWSCAACHTYVDSHKDDATQLAFAHGVFRTLNQLYEMGAL